MRIFLGQGQGGRALKLQVLINVVRSDRRFLELLEPPSWKQIHRPEPLLVFPEMSVRKTRSLRAARRFNESKYRLTMGWRAVDFPNKEKLVISSKNSELDIKPKTNPQLIIRMLRVHN